MRAIPHLLAIFLLCVCPLHAAENLCPNPGFELGDGASPASWTPQPCCFWDTEHVHSGQRSIKIANPEPAKSGWTSEIITFEDIDTELALSVWARLDDVSGRNGTYIGIYHLV